jgi:hypothetical protein
MKPIPRTSWIFFDSSLYTSDFFSILSFRTKSDDQPPEDLAKSGYKSKRQVEKSKNITGGEPLYLLAKYEDFKRGSL